MDDILVRTAPLPGSIKAFTCKKSDYYTIIINEYLDESQRLKEYEHELNHIRNGDYDNSYLSSDMVEIIAHKQ